MARWQPGARERLQAVTLELFAEQGFEGTTVAEIASRAGLTERTFFRYFTDKREVLFTGQDTFEGMFVDQIAAAPRRRATVRGRHPGAAGRRDGFLPARAPNLLAAASDDHRRPSWPARA